MAEWFTPAELLFSLFIVLARVLDVTIGTVRTICVVRGFGWVAAVLGFVEVIIWVLAVSGVLAELTPLRVVAYGLGFALGNASGIMMEQKLALGQQMVVLVSRRQAHSVAFALRLANFLVTEVEAHGGHGQVAMALVAVPRRKTDEVIRLARAADPNVFTVVNDIRGTSVTREAGVVPPTGWRALIKKK